LPRKTGLFQGPNYAQSSTNVLLSIKGTGTCSACGNPSAGDENFTYDGNGNVATRTDALNHTTQFTYEPVFHKVTSITEPTNPPATTSFTYDTKGNLVERKDANNHTTSFTYDAFGLLTKIKDPLNKETTFGYDSFGNLTSITDPLNHVTSFRYDAISRQIETTDALSRKSGTAYDKLSRVMEQTNAKGDKTKFAYDKVGNLLSVTDAQNNTTEFMYDDMNRLKTKKTPLGKTDTRTYDLNGNLKTFTDRRNLTSQYTYDALDRLVSETYADSNVERIYDAQSRLLRVDDSVGGIFSFSYDLVGRTKNATSPVGVVQYDYDEVGRVLSRQVVGQPPVDYDYDPVGNLTKAEMPQAGATFAYDERDQLHLMNRSNGVSSTYDYDDVGRVLSLKHAKGSTIPNAQTYDYDEVGNRMNYGTNVAQPLITQPVMNGQYDNDNKLLSNSDKTFTYDDNGNLKTETGPEGTTTYTWDARNRLKSLALPNGQTINFLYDFAGNLIRKSVSGASPSSQEFILDELTNIAYQKNSDGSQMSILTGQSIDSHLAVVGAGGQVDFGLTDTINSTTATTDQNRALDSQFFYEPFGQTTTSSDYPFQFTGRVPVTGNLYHYRARFYHPIVGRFVSEDPFNPDRADFNRFPYVKNAPINLRDPFGLVSDDEFEVHISAPTPRGYPPSPQDPTPDPTPPSVPPQPSPPSICQDDDCKIYKRTRRYSLYFICRNAGHGPWPDCVRSCLQRHFVGGFYTDIEPLFGPNIHLICFTICSARSSES
jgi:RHS repeat-associated protein